MKGFFVIVITALVLSWLAAQARKAKARRAGGTWLFPPITAVQILYGTLAMSGLGLVLAGYLGPLQDRDIVVSVGLLFVVFSSVTWPKTVELSKLGVRQRSWWGGWQIIHWEEITSSEQRRDGSVIVRAKNCKVVLSPFHADRDLFLRQVKGGPELVASSDSYRGP